MTCVSAKLQAQRTKEEQKRLAEQKLKEKEAEEAAENAGDFLQFNFSVLAFVLGCDCPLHYFGLIAL